MIYSICSCVKKKKKKFGRIEPIRRRIKRPFERMIPLLTFVWSSVGPFGV